MSIRKTQYGDDSSVRFCHPEGACRKITTRSLQLNTKMKKRTPPALFNSFRLTHCIPSGHNGVPYFLRRVNPITPHFSVTARAPNNRRENISIDIETKKQTRIAAPLSYRLTLCHACNSDQNRSARERRKILESEPKLCYFLAIHTFGLFYFGFASSGQNSISCGAIILLDHSPSFFICGRRLSRSAHLVLYSFINHCAPNSAAPALRPAGIAGVGSLPATAGARALSSRLHRDKLCPGK